MKQLAAVAQARKSNPPVSKTKVQGVIHETDQLVDRPASQSIKRSEEAAKAEEDHTYTYIHSIDDTERVFVL